MDLWIQGEWGWFIFNFSPSHCDRYGHFSGINRKVQLTYLPHGHPKAASEDEGKEIRHCCRDL